MNMRLVIGVSLFLMTLTVGPSVDAATVNFNLQLALDPFQIYECGGGAYPEGTQCWTNLSVDLFKVPRTTIRPEDTIRIELEFVGPYRLQWADDGLFSATGVDEQVQVGAWDSLGPSGFEGSWDNSLSFQRVQGDLNANNLAWTMVGESGGFVSPSEFSGITNLTDSSFSFSGLLSHIGPFSGTGLPGDVDRVEIFFTSGQFSIVSVPEPGTLALCGIGLGFFAGIFRSRDALVILGYERSAARGNSIEST